MDTTKGVWYVCVGQGVELASLADYARSVVGVCALENAGGSKGVVWKRRGGRLARLLR